jgi:proline-specific peptidase
MTTAVEGMIPFQGHQTWYRIVGDGQKPGKLPLLCLHGGPGACHDYLESLEEFSETGRRVVFYDQVGCGKSSRTDESMWNVETFVDEVDTVRNALGLGETHVFGSSWGGMLAMEYALTRPQGVASLVISSAPASIPLWAREANRLRSELPEDVQRVLDEHEDAGTIDSPNYEAASMEFYRRHVCRLDPWPDGLVRTFTQLAENPGVYLYMQGPNEFVITGTFKDWDITGRLPEIDVPTLITSGRYDECTPMQAEIVHSGIRGSEWVVFEESSHMQFAEEPDRYREVLDDFLARVEAGR